MNTADNHRDTPAASASLAPVAEHVPAARQQALAEATAHLNRGGSLTAWVQQSDQADEVAIRAGEMIVALRAAISEVSAVRATALQSLDADGEGLSGRQIRYLTGLSRGRISEIQRGVSGHTKVRRMGTERARAYLADQNARARARRDQRATPEEQSVREGESAA